MTQTLAELAKAAKRSAVARKRAKEADDARDVLIRQAKAEGETLRAIGTVAGMTAPGIQRVLDRTKTTDVS